MQGRIVAVFMVIVAAVILFMLPLTEMIYDFRTDQRADDFTVTTAAGVTTANVTLGKPVFDDDTQTISFSSNTTTDIPVVSSYNVTSRQLLIAGLTASTTRAVEVTYDIDALTGEGSAISSLMDRVPAVYLLIVIAFPIAATVAVLIGRV